MPIMQSAAQDRLIQSDYYVEGYAMRYERYVLFEDEGGKIYEEFLPQCFAGCNMSDVIMQYDHRGHVYARQSNKSLILLPDNIGLKIGADLSRTNSAKEMYEEISTGMSCTMSWSFLPGRYHFDEARSTLVHESVKKIYDVSAVSIAANPDTEIYARNFCDGEIAKIKQERLEGAKAKLRLKLKLGGF